MELIKWDESYSVKIESIDEQHKKLIDMLNEFYNNIQSKSSKESIAKLLNQMKAYAMFHFETEERYMKQYGFPEHDFHKKEHNEFIEKVKDIEKRFNAGELIVSFEITNYLKKWLKDHINGTDKRYSWFLVDKGVK